MAQFTWNNFIGGLSDFSYKGNEDQWTDGENVDIYTDPFNVGTSVQEVFQGSHNYLSGSKTISPANWVYYILGDQVVPHNDLSGPITAVQGATHHIFIYDDQTVQNPTSLGKNYFFMGNYSGGWIKRTTDSTPGSVDSTITIQSFPITDIVQVYTTILFSQGSKVYSFDLVTQTVSQKAVVDTIPFGEKIVGMHFYMDTLYIVANISNLNRVKVYTLRYEGGMYDISNYHIVNGIQAVSIYGENGTIYWASESSIYITNGYESQVLKRIRTTVPITRIRGYGNGIIILTSQKYYILKSIFPGSKKLTLTKYDGAYVDYYSGMFLQNGSYYMGSTGYCETSYIDSNTLDLGDINRTKYLTGITLHCDNKRGTYIDSTVQSKLEVYVRLNETKYVLVGTYSENARGILYISDNEIVNALSTEGISPEFQVINFRIKRYSGDKSSGGMSPNVYRFFPTFSKLTCSYALTDDPLPR